MVQTQRAFDELRLILVTEYLPTEPHRLRTRLISAYNTNEPRRHFSGELSLPLDPGEIVQLGEGLVAALTGLLWNLYPPQMQMGADLEQP